MWTMLWEILGLGSGSMPLAARYIPPIGGVLYWLRPGHRATAAVARQGAADRRHAADAARRRALRGRARRSRVYLLVSDGEAVAGTAAGASTPTAIAVLLGLLGVLGLRDKVSFLAARPEVYGFMLIVVALPGVEP